MTTYDAIVVGARCAGSPLAMLLARKGHRVLLVDRATFPSDTVSTHMIHPRGAAALSRWGLLQRVVSTGCPPIHTYAFDFGPLTIEGSPGTAAHPVGYCPRRTVLDKILVDAAVEAGAELREGFTVEEVLVEDGRVRGIRGRSAGGDAVTAQARVVVGADGRHSKIAEAVQPERYHERPALLASYYTYYSDLPIDGRFEVYIRPLRGCAAIPTNDGLTLVIAGWPYAEFEANKKDVEGHFGKVLDLVPDLARRVRGAKRVERMFGAAIPNFFRKPYGPGWALVGDAGYIKDPITAQGIADAFHDAERCAAALDASFRGERAFDDVMAEQQRVRDEGALPMYDFTCGLATLEPPPPEVQRILGAIHGKKDGMDAFVRMNAGTISPAEFFAPAHVASLLAAA